MGPELPDPSLGPYLRALQEALSSRVRLEALWLVGSVATGDYVPGASDVDVIAVSAGRIGAPVAAELARELSHSRIPCPARQLELVVYAREELRRPARRPRFDLNLNTGAGSEDHAGFDPADEPGHWFLLDLAMARERSLPLLGPPATELVPEPPREWLLDALVESIDWHLASEPASADAVLNACRAWRYAAEGTWSSKGEAAHWAREHRGAGDLIDRALAARREAGPLPESEVRAFLELVRAGLRRAV